MHELPGGKPPELVNALEGLNALEKNVIDLFKGGRRDVQTGRFSASRLIGSRLTVYIMEKNSPGSDPEDLAATAFYSATYPDLLGQMARGEWGGTRDYFLGEARDSIGISSGMLRHPNEFREEIPDEFEKYGQACMNLANSLGA